MAKKFELVEVDGMFGLLSEKTSYAPEDNYHVFPARIGLDGQIGRLQESGWLNNRGDFITKDHVLFDQNGIYEPVGNTHYLGKRMSLEQFADADNSFFADQFEVFKTKHPDMSSNYTPSLSRKTGKMAESVFDGYRKLEKAEEKLEKAYMATTIGYLDTQISGFKNGLDYFSRIATLFLDRIFHSAETTIEHSENSILDKKQMATKDTPDIAKPVTEPLEQQLETIRKRPSMLKQIQEQTPEICIAAVSEDYRTLSMVREQSPVICLTAVKLNGNALEFVREQTQQICMEAVKQTGGTLQYVKHQTPELCAEAIKQDPLALKYVKNPSKELCIEAVRHNHNAISFVPESFLPTVRQLVPEKGLNIATQKAPYRSSVELVR